MRISVIVIAKDEAAVIERCLGSVSWADEIVVLDSGSRDDTVVLARRHTPNVHVTDWPGFGPQKNRALDHATGDWVLSLDADEWVSEELARALRDAARDPGPHAAFRMPRSSSFCGREMRHSGWWPDHVIRFFRRGAARFSDDLVHERLVVDGSIGTLRVPLHHETFVDLEELLEKMNSYSTLAARDMQARGKHGSLAVAIAKSLWAFVRSYVLRRGFLDGREGFMLAVSTAEGTYYRYVKLLLLQRRR
jgi:glycosyltransferase involved in cell wall biosynthesis